MPKTEGILPHSGALLPQTPFFGEEQWSNSLDSTVYWTYPGPQEVAIAERPHSLIFMDAAVWCGEMRGPTWCLDARHGPQARLGATKNPNSLLGRAPGLLLASKLPDC